MTDRTDKCLNGSNALQMILAGALALHGTFAAAQTSPINADQAANNIFFPSGGAELDQAAQQQLLRLSEVLQTSALNDACLKLTGHADATGDASINQEISVARASAVADRIITLIGDASRVELVYGLGESAPLATLSPESPWQRRVTIHARKCPNYRG